MILPYRMVHMAHPLPKEHIINTEIGFPRRDIALWMPKSKQERPDIMDLANRLEQYFHRLEENTIPLPWENSH